jgi:Flp pilus assembly protein TadD
MPAPHYRLLSLVLPAMALAACTTKPTATETAMMELATSNTILPASRADRDAIAQKDVLSQATFWGSEYDKNPNDHEAALQFARTLRGMGSSARAAEVSGQALAMKPGDPELTLIFAQASLDTGRPDAAATALARAESAAATDWRMLSIIGVTMDQLGRHEGAQQYYAKALAVSPDNPGILSNLGLSYALQGNPALAEETLRKAASGANIDPRVKQNLVLVLGVQGKFDEAEKAAGPETPKALLQANTDYFRSLLSPSRSWDRLRGASN